MFFQISLHSEISYENFLQCYYPEAYSGRAMGAHPPLRSVKYMLFLGGGLGLTPLKRKRNLSPSWEKNPEYASLNIFKTLSSSQPLVNLSKCKSEDQEIYFEDLHFSVSQIVHSLFYRLCMQALLFCLKLFIVQ